LKKRLLPLLISLALLALLVARVEARALLEALAAMRMGWFALGIALFIPQLWAISHRWQLIVRPLTPLGIREAGRQVVASSCLNLVLPSKLGDLAKGAFLFRQGRTRLEDAVQVVVFEKLLDLAALSAWMIAGWALAPRGGGMGLAAVALGAAVVAAVALVYFVPREASILARLIPARAGGRFADRIRALFEAGPRVMKLVHADAPRRNRILAWSVGIWLLHLLQIDCFFRCMNAGPGLLNVLATMPLAIFAGLLPVSVAGVGVRDWAIVTLFAQPGTSPAALAATGLLVTLRYLVPAAMGVPFAGSYLATTGARAAKAPATSRE